MIIVVNLIVKHNRTNMHQSFPFEQHVSKWYELKHGLKCSYKKHHKWRSPTNMDMNKTVKICIAYKVNSKTLPKTVMWPVYIFLFVVWLISNEHMANVSIVLVQHVLIQVVIDESRCTTTWFNTVWARDTLNSINGATWRGSINTAWQLKSYTSKHSLHLEDLTVKCYRKGIPLK